MANVKRIGIQEQVMDTTEASETIRDRCIQVSIYITDAHENPYCGIINKVLCDEKKSGFEEIVMEYVKKYGEVKNPDAGQSAQMFADMLDICQEYESVKSDKFIIPNAYLHVTMGENGLLEESGITWHRDTLMKMGI